MNYYNLAESARVLFLLYSALFNPFTFALQHICPGVESVVVLITDLRILRTDHLLGLYSNQFGYQFISILISNGLCPEILYLTSGRRDWLVVETSLQTSSDPSYGECEEQRRRYFAIPSYQTEQTNSSGPPSTTFFPESWSCGF